MMGFDITETDLTKEQKEYIKIQMQQYMNKQIEDEEEKIFLPIILKDFIKTDTYLFADCIEFIGKNCDEIDLDLDCLKNAQVIDYHVSTEQAGLLEIQLNL